MARTGTDRPGGDGEGAAARNGGPPRLITRVVDVQLELVALMAGGFAFFCSLAIWQKTSAELDVPRMLIVELATALGILALEGVAWLALSGELRALRQRRRLSKDGYVLVREARKSLDLHSDRLKPEQREEVAFLAGQIEREMSEGAWPRVAEHVDALDRKLDESLASVRKSTAREYAESIFVAVGIALFLRAFVVEAFKIPSGSMIPTLQVGDHIFVNKFIYGVRVPWTNIKFGMDVRKPRRGEVIVFKFPKDPDKDFIKRIVGIEGDTVEIKDNVVFVNGVAVPRRHVDNVPCEYEDFEEVQQRWEHRRCDAFEEDHDGHKYTTIFDRGNSPHSWPAVTVPPRSVFVMGDNRDNSHDSRYWGFVPFELLKGKAMVIWWSSGEPEGIRVKRMGQAIE